MSYTVQRASQVADFLKRPASFRVYQCVGQAHELERPPPFVPDETPVVKR